MYSEHEGIIVHANCGSAIWGLSIGRRPVFIRGKRVTRKIAPRRSGMTRVQIYLQKLLLREWFCINPQNN